VNRIRECMGRAGMLRVLEAINGSDSAGNLTAQQDDLINWVNEILDGTWVHQASSHSIMLTNEY